MCFVMRKLIYICQTLVAKASSVCIRHLRKMNNPRATKKNCAEHFFALCQVKLDGSALEFALDKITAKCVRSIERL